MSFLDSLLSSAKQSLSSTRFLLIFTGININLIFDGVTIYSLWNGKILDGSLALLGSGITLLGVVAGLKYGQGRLEANDPTVTPPVIPTAP